MKEGTKFFPNRQIGVGAVSISALQKQYVNQALDSGRLSAGPFTAAFEKQIAQLHGAAAGVMMNSGTGALQVALQALKEKYVWNDGDEVIVPALTFLATSNIVLYNNMRPVFVDIDPATYNINSRLIESAITPKTRAIIVAHLFGLACDMAPIVEIAERHKLRIIEDACEAMLAEYHGQPVGSFGDVGCFSTYAAHILVTGVGGIAVTSDPDLELLMRSIMNYGRDPVYLRIDDDQARDPKVLSEIVSRRFSFVRLGQSFRATELEAALGMGQLVEKEAILAKRAAHAAYLTERLKEQDGYRTPFVPAGYRHVFMMYPLLVDASKLSAAEVTQYLEARLIETRPTLPLLSQPVYRRLFGDIEDRYPEAKNVAHNGFYVGCHPSLSSEELEYMADELCEAARLLGRAG